jgi:hypothetical protein
MAQFFEDFRGMAVDFSPPDFSTMWNGPHALSIKAGNPLADSDKYLEILPLENGGYQRSAVKWDVGTTSGKTTVRLLLELNGTYSGPFLSGSGPVRFGYVNWWNSTNRLEKYEGSTDFELATGAAQATGTLPQNCYLEMVRDGSLIEIRSWNFADSRPVVADVSYTDGDPLPVAGFFGISHLVNAREVMKVYEIAVGTDGESAPTKPAGTSQTPVLAIVESTTEGQAVSIATATSVNALPGSQETQGVPGSLVQVDAVSTVVIEHVTDVTAADVQQTLDIGTGSTEQFTQAQLLNNLLDAHITGSVIEQLTPSQTVEVSEAVGTLSTSSTEQLNHAEILKVSEHVAAVMISTEQTTTTSETLDISASIGAATVDAEQVTASMLISVEMPDLVIDSVECVTQVETVDVGNNYTFTSVTVEQYNNTGTITLTKNTLFIVSQVEQATEGLAQTVEHLLLLDAQSIEQLTESELIELVQSNILINVNKLQIKRYLSIYTVNRETKFYTLSTEHGICLQTFHT